MTTITVPQPTPKGRLSHLLRTSRIARIAWLLLMIASSSAALFQSTTVGGQLITILTTPLFVPAVLSMGLYFALTTVALGLLVLGLIVTLRRSPVPGAKEDLVTQPC